MAKSPKKPTPKPSKPVKKAPVDRTARPVPHVVPPPVDHSDAESQRLIEDAARGANWKRWGPYLPERQWGTVREDYSADGNCWNYLPHDHARSRAYRWGEDGLLGFTDRQCRLCFSLALWNGVDPILKERLYGLTGNEGNHGEDVKELYYYLDSTPTHSYAKALYKYPQAEFPYKRLLDENRGRGRDLPEYEVTDTGVFDANRYWDVFIEYAKGGPEDIAIRITVHNRGPATATLDVLPQLVFRNTWDWNDPFEGDGPKPAMHAASATVVAASHPSLGDFRWQVQQGAELLFTENETNRQRIWGAQNKTPFVKDAFHSYVTAGNADAVNPAKTGTKSAARYRLEVPAGGSTTIKLRLTATHEPAAKTIAADPLGAGYDRVFTRAIAEADAFYQRRIPAETGTEDRRIAREAYAGMLWQKQFYYYVVDQWLPGDKGQPPPPASREKGRNSDWVHLFNRDVLSMPDKWEYPWYAAWDLAFHTVTYARIDPEYAKEQLQLLLREWYMHPNGQIPAYEFNFSDVNPPVHAWATWRVYKETGRTDRLFLERVFQKLLLNFTWWVNRKDAGGKHVFAGGFLGLDNIGVFDRSKPLPSGGSLTQADGTAWMAFYCIHMLSMALELAQTNPAYEDIASKFFEHFTAITHAMNTLGGTGLWDDTDGFYYDQLEIGGQYHALNVRSMVGLIPLCAVSVLDEVQLDRLPGFKKRMEWFLANEPELARHVVRATDRPDGRNQILLSIVPLERLTRVLHYALDENEFLSPHGLRSLSRAHHDKPYMLDIDGARYGVEYEPADSRTSVFGGNSNWRGPVWFPLNVLLLQALERVYHFYGDGLRVKYPSRSGNAISLHHVTRDLANRMVSLFRADKAGRRPSHGDQPRYASDPHFKDLLLFHEYFDGDNGRGLGACHQTGWTGLVANLIDDLATDGNPAPSGLVTPEPAATVKRTAKPPAKSSPPRKTAARR